MSPAALWSAVCMGALAAFPAVWWVLGRLDHSGDWIVDPDYAIQPPQVDRTLTHLIGVLAVVAVVASGALLSWNLASGHIANLRTRPVISLALASAYMGLTAHVATAPDIGANIGFGLLVLGAVPILFVLAVFAFVPLG